MIGHNISQSILPFPPGFSSVKDVITIYGTVVKNTEGWLFLLYNFEKDTNANSKEVIKAYNKLTNPRPHILFSSDVRFKLFDGLDAVVGSEFKLQIFHRQTDNSVRLITENGNVEYEGFSERMLDETYVTIRLIAGVVSYSYVSVCRPIEPNITMSTPEIVLDVPLQITCHISGPPFLEGYLEKDGVRLEGTETTRSDDSQPLHSLTLTYTTAAVLAGSIGDVLGLYSCIGQSSLFPEKEFRRDVTVEYSVPLDIAR